MHRPLKSIIYLIVLPLFLLSTNLLAATQYSRVFFFGDSLSDIGNNQDGFSDNAPITNMVEKDGKYVAGNTWVVPFVKNLKTDGLLPSNKVDPSRLYDLNINIDSSDNVDYAYTGDPSDGYPFNGHGYTVEFHKINHENDACVSDHTSSNSNDLCGAKNRIRDFINKTIAEDGTLDSNALYVIWIGPNDILQDLGAKLQKDVEAGIIIDPNTYQKAQGIKTIMHVTSSIGSAISNLKRHGAKNFVVINLPNLGFTPDGFTLNFLYNHMHPNKPQDVIKTLFTNLANNFNDQLKTTLDNLQKTDSITIIQPNINKLFNMVRDGKIAAFPTTSSKVNKNPTYAWVSNCCGGQSATYPTYDPTMCQTESENSQCTGGTPKLPNDQGSYVFFNGIHPTTCAHKYVAAFVESYLPNGKPFDPSINLCQPS